jgi:hypothetical protein
MLMVSIFLKKNFFRAAKRRFGATFLLPDAT